MGVVIYEFIAHYGFVILLVIGTLLIAGYFFWSLLPKRGRNRA